MAYTTPRTWVAAETVDEDHMNEQVRDNIAYLKTQADKHDDITFSNPTRVKDTIYQNSTKIRICLVTLSLIGDGSSIATAEAITDANSTPTTVVGYLQQVNSGSEANYYTITFLVQPNHYYRVLETGVTGGSISVQEWTEWDIL